MTDKKTNAVLAEQCLSNDVRSNDHGNQATLILVSTLSRVKSVFMSMRACLVSLYTVPRKLRGIES